MAQQMPWELDKPDAPVAGAAAPWEMDKPDEQPQPPKQVQTGAPLMDMVLNTMQRRQAIAQSGVSLSGAPTGLRARVSFAPESKREEAWRNEINTRYGSQGAVRIGPVSQGVEFSIDGGKSWTMAEPPGPQMGDVGAMAGPAMGMAGSVAGAALGGIGGAATGTTVAGPAGTIPGATGGGMIGGALGTAAAEYRRYQIAKANGTITTPDEELLREALFAGGVDLAIALPTFGVGRVARLFNAGSNFKQLTEPQLKQMEQNLLKIAEENKKIKAATGREFKPTVSQSMSGVPGQEAARELETTAMARVPGGAVERAKGEQLSIGMDVAQAVERETPPAPVRAGTTDPELAVGSDVRRVLGAQDDEARAAQAGNVESAQQRLDAAVLRTTQGAVSPTSAGNMAREGWAGGKAAIQQDFRNRYELARREYGGEFGVQVDMTGPRRLAMQFNRVLQRDLMPRLKTEDKALWKDFTSRVQHGQKVEFDQVQRALSDIREELRSISTGTSPVKGTKELHEMEDALLRARDRALQPFPQLKQEIEKLETDYRAARETLDRTMLGTLLNRAEGGVWRVRDENVIERMLDSETGTREVLEAVRNPAYAEHLGGERAIKQGVLGLYRNRVLKDGTFNRAQHDRFINDYKESLPTIFNADEMRSFNTVGGAARRLEREKGIEAELTKYLNKSIGTQMQEWDAGAVVDKVWSTRERETLYNVMRRLAPHKELLAEFKGAVASRVRGEILDYDPNKGMLLPSAQKLGDLLFKPENGPWRASVQEVFGKRYYEGLHTLQQVFRMWESLGTPLASATATGQAITAPTSLPWTHYMRVLFGTPFARSSAIAGGLKTKAELSVRRLDKLLADPQAMIDLVRMRRLSPTSGAYSVVFSDLARRVGYDEGPTTNDEALGLTP